MKRLLLGLSFIACYSSLSVAQNPFVQTWFTSDPAPMVHDGTLYVYTGHDEDKADFFWMQEWRVYSTQDMVNWTDHGSPLALESFSWADDRAWASQTIERNGKFYWYICAHSKISGGMAIGVAVSDTPTGPFRDAIGKPLFENGSWDHIDPTVMIDDNNQAWIMWGNPKVYYAKLNDDMISFDGEVKNLPMTEEAFGGPLMGQREPGKKYKDSYVEGPWLMKAPLSSPRLGGSREAQIASPNGGRLVGAYFLLYAAGGIPEHISYSTAPSPEGPWTYAGEIMPQSDTNSFTNHCGVADFKGHSYFFYHTGKLPEGGGFGRSVAVEEFKYNADGSFPTILPTDEGVEPIDKFDPYRRVEAETMAFSRGVKTEQNDEVGVYVTDIHNGDYIKLQDVHFCYKTPRTFTARVASGLRGGKIELRIDSLGGQLLGTLEVPATGGWEKWQTLTTDLTAIVRGHHDLYFVFTGRKGPKLFNFDWWEMRGLEQVNMPLFQTKYTADPSPIVVGDTLFLFTSHDSSPEDIADPNERNSAGFFMYDWLLWSTTDMVNWTEHGAVASLKDFPWRSRDNGAWAIQTVERNGKYYLYAPLHGHGIGVLESDSPYGPFKDPLGKPLVWQQEHWEDIDPSVYTDDDGQAYMYWGNPHTFWAKLGEDMTSLTSSVTQLPHIPNYQEGPWFYKRSLSPNPSPKGKGSKYYLAFATTCCPEALGYAMSDSPTGPWEWKGYIMEPTQRDRGNHPGICDFKGKSYIFGQNYDLMHLDTFEHHERRSVSATEITYNADGTIQQVPYWLDQAPIAQIGHFNPYQRVEAETMAWGYGLKSAKMGIENTGIVANMPESTGRRNMYIYDIDDGEYIRLRGVDFGSGAKQFSITAAATGGVTVTLRLDSVKGEVIGTAVISKTGSIEKYKPFKTKVKGAQGVHDLYLCFDKKQGDVRLDWWRFNK